MKLLSGAASVLVGALIYLLFRGKQLLGFELLKRIGVEPWADKLRSYVSDLVLPDIFVYALPNGLWTLGYILSIDHVFDNCSRMQRIAWAAVIPLLGICSEMLQGMGVIPGTFDTWDLVCYAFPYIIYIIVI